MHSNLWLLLIPAMPVVMFFTILIVQRRPHYRVINVIGGSGKTGL